MGVQPNIGIGSHQPVQDAKADRVFSGLIYVISDDFGQIWKMSKLIHTHTGRTILRTIWFHCILIVWCNTLFYTVALQNCIWWYFLVIVIVFYLLYIINYILYHTCRCQMSCHVESFLLSLTVTYLWTKKTNKQFIMKGYLLDLPPPIKKQTFPWSQTARSLFASTALVRDLGLGLSWCRPWMGCNHVESVCRR